jgi:hypothetical protein
MKCILPLVAIAALVLTLSGCQSTPQSGDNWPYKGPPMVGTNNIPVPKW